MELDPQTYDRIESYLLGTLSEADRSEFERTLTQDSALDEEFRLHKEMFEGLEDAALKAELKGLHAELVDGPTEIPKSKRKLYLIAAGILLFIFSYIGYLILREPTPKPDPKKDTIEKVEPKKEATPMLNNTPAPEVLKKKVEATVEANPVSKTSLAVSEKSIERGDDVQTDEIEELETEVPVKPAVFSTDSLTEKEDDLPMNMVLISGGAFRMGNAGGARHELPIRTVTVSDFYMDKTEVTNREFCQFLNAQNAAEQAALIPKWADIKERGLTKISEREGSYQPFRNMGDFPVVGITWTGAHAYATYVGKRLPTEAEWEYAARGGKFTKGKKYAGAENPKDISWNDLNASGRPHRVGEKSPNELGLYDMSGNVWEWCADRYDLYPSDDQINPKGPDYGSERVLRSGSFKDFDALRVASRHRFDPSIARGDIGFRCVK